MVSIAKIVSSSLIFAANDQFRDVGSADLAAKTQYNIVKYMYGNGPYMQNPGYGISTDVPDQCTLEHVQVYMRHGERYPGISDGKKQKALVDKLQSYKSPLSGPLSFLNDYEYYVKDDSLYELETTPSNAKGPFTGYETCNKAGLAFRAKYNDLYNENETLPVFIAASKRVYDLADFFVNGFLGEDYEEDKIKRVVISEDKSSGFNSLTPRWACPLFYNPNNTAPKFKSDYLEDIADRLKKDNDGLNLTSSDIPYLFQLCSFELNSKGYSQFCDIFTQDELVTNDYAQGFDSYHSAGSGSETSKYAGSVQLNTSLALLKEDDPKNKIVLSFTHDTDIQVFYASLGLFDVSGEMPSDQVDVRNAFRRTEVVPMGGRLITEKYKCDGKSYVRFIANDAVIPLQNCSDGPGFSCSLSDFEDIVNKKQSFNLLEECSTPDDIPHELTFYWDYDEKNYNATAPRVTA